MAHRSPILGYNHNISYRGLVFHVQTEDSGVSNPHIFTHLFHKGVILSTRRLEYDAQASDDAVKSLMQAQHRAVLKELKKGSFDEKIDTYLKGQPELLPRSSTEQQNRKSTIKTPLAVVRPPPTVEEHAAPVPRVSSADVSAAFQSIQSLPTRKLGQRMQNPRRTPRRQPTPIPQAPPPLSPNPTTSPQRPPAPNTAKGQPVGPKRDQTKPGPGRPPARPPGSRPTTVGPQVTRPPAARPPATRPPATRPPATRPPAKRPPAMRPPNTRAPTSRPNVNRGQPVRPSPPPVTAQSSSRSNVLISKPPIVVANRKGGRPPGPAARAARTDETARPAGTPARPAAGAGGSTHRSAPPPVPGASRPGGRRAPAAPGKQSPTRSPTPGRRPPSRTIREDSSDGIFEQNLISEKSLDEVILAYLSEDNPDE